MTALQKHETVLLKPAVDQLVSDSSGIYIDGTYGRGGHSREILSRLSENGQLLGIDKDPRAIESARELAASDARFSVKQCSFAGIGDELRSRDWLGKLDGVLLDLGVSSPQLDEAERGFSFTQDGPLDMRMNPQDGVSASEWIMNAAESEIADVLYHFGEERFSRRIAKAIVKARAEQRITRTLQLAEIVKEANPAWERHKHPATRAFQAIRIHVNNELSDVTELLEQVISWLRPGGRLVVISFHSLEDRIVKQFIRRHSQGEPIPRGVPIMDEERQVSLKKIGKAIMPEREETTVNPRARSAVMRVAEKK
ncbi:ribosomal RNA small subunit methyltransferase H [Pseudohongiella nitratireducens]|uniref:Ribosomal RNA small subunit methyltransferase H n=1 Tax=Pseudohongiella nitratireducens TaxID=1768907 RepID=A0A916QKV8_9GAMM|nr:16S rRNA (cytosine(1402)-N(4))-methyltransferase RsmH [Pseudohongiella nitratireducens]MDF1623062.1 16S rRNA (cytosine(1402)-N(4))-methyltransferase RsmH [Pseudohongiella nitratireducens]GFZ78765.1 ribosomal RNA small subunit methyltransferase H [Pseudohongiella nitratireducens]|tara:strand:- start:4799 stop:5731 length:933 start_codon:yes stop_codon:yes gene_type:complete